MEVPGALYIVQYDAILVESIWSSLAVIDGVVQSRSGLMDREFVGGDPV